MQDATPEQEPAPEQESGPRQESGTKPGPAKNEWVPIEQPGAAVVEHDMDALHVLPLSILPLTSPALRNLKMIKNYQLQSVIEVFNLRRKVSHQIDVDMLGNYFGWENDETHPDLPVLREIARLPSFDVFSLRHLLRELGHDVNDDSNLKLSDSMTAGLSGYMAVFTRPLISRIFAGENVDVRGPGGLIKLFNHPDRNTVLRRLELMAQEMQTDIESVPGVLENYGDLLLSLAFYKHCLDEVTPIITEFLETMDMVTSNQMLARDEELMEICASVQGQVNDMTAAIAQRFQDLDQKSREIWSGDSQQGFKDLEALVKAHHKSISGVLCGLTVKMKVWDRLFPDKETASPAQLADFIKFQMRQGLEIMQEVQLEADGSK